MLYNYSVKVIFILPSVTAAGSSPARILVLPEFKSLTSTLCGSEENTLWCKILFIDRDGVFQFPARLIKH